MKTKHVAPFNPQTFLKKGSVYYNGGLHVHSSLINVVLHE